MMIRVKQVINITNAGIKPSAVIINKICRLTEYSCWPAASVVNLIAEMDKGASAAKTLVVNTNNPKTNIKRASTLIPAHPLLKFSTLWLSAEQTLNLNDLQVC